eukprot:g50211.t1
MKCVHCTFLNGHNALACDMCASPKPAAAPASYIAETSKVGSSASNGEQWTWACLQCTHLNGSDATACDVCFSPKPAAALPSGVPLAAAAVGHVVFPPTSSAMRYTYLADSESAPGFVLGDTKQTMVEPPDENEDDEDEDEETA